VNPTPTGFAGLLVLDSLVHRDDRGVTRKIVTSTLLAESGLDPHIEEVLGTSNDVAGTIRGLHYQVAPMAQSKTLWVTSGEIFDVVVDLRADQPTYGRTWSTTLRAEDDVALHVPAGFAHGYQTLCDDARLTYLISRPHSPQHARTLAWDDPHLEIPWPREAARMSPSDQAGAPWPGRP
jgi:dTDP-4-dehydrorhamnose 3,5-epimerase